MASMPSLNLHHTEVNDDHNTLDGWTKPNVTSCLNGSPQEIALTMDARVNGEAMGAVLTSQTLMWTSSTSVPPSTCLQGRSQVSVDTTPTGKRTAVTV